MRARDRSPAARRASVAANAHGPPAHVAAAMRVEKRRLVEQGMADAAVAPVEQHQSVGRAAEIAGMEIAVHQRVRQSARCDLGKAPRQTGDEAIERCRIVRRELAARALDHAGISRRSAPPRASRAVRSPQAFRGGRSTTPAGRPAGSPCRAAVAAPPRTCPRPESRRAGRGRHRARATRGTASPASASSTRPSCAKNGGTTFSHTVCPPTGMRQTLDRFQLRTWTGAPGQRDAVRVEHGFRPGEIGRRPAGLGIGLPQRVPVEPPVPRFGRHGFCRTSAR